MSDKKYIVGKVADIVDRGRKIVEVAGREIGIYRLGNEFFAILNRCPHLGGPLCKGDVVTEISATEPGAVRGDPSKVYVTCPWHNWEFDIRTGRSYLNPNGPRARAYPVSVEDGDAVRNAIEQGGAERVEGPYRAEHVPISVEDEFLVLRLGSAVAHAKSQTQSNGASQ
jgi:nitrite reductase/ring-hydroxylating ferredoxin subunit